MRHIDAPVLRWRDADEDPETGDGGLEECLTFCQDANMNVTALEGAASGNVVQRYAYDPYGKPTFLEPDCDPTQLGQGPPGTLSAYANDVLFAGYRWDAETGLYHVRHRYYHPTLGRWSAQDAVGCPVSQDASVSLSQDGPEATLRVASHPAYSEALGAPLRQLESLGSVGAPALLVNARTIASLQEQIRALVAIAPRGLRLSPRAPHDDGASLYQYVRSQPEDGLDPTGLAELGWFDRILAAANGLPGVDYAECVCACVHAGNAKAEAFVRDHLAAAEALVAAEAAAAAASTPLRKEMPLPGDKEYTALATRIAVRAAMGKSGIAYQGMRFAGRYGHYAAIATAVGVGLAELGLEGWCAYMCAHDSAFRL